MATSTFIRRGHMNNPPMLASSYGIGTEQIPWNFGSKLPTYDPAPVAGENLDQSLYTLPEAYIGQSEFIGQTMELISLSNNNFITALMLPVVLTDQMRSHWVRWEFKPVIPDLVPELGSVRFVKSNHTSGSAALKRYGIGFQLSHSFLETEMGKMHFFMHLRQINQAFNEGMQLDALWAIVNVENWEIAKAAENGMRSEVVYANQMKKILDRELFAWAVLQKFPNAWSIMNTYIDTQVKEYNDSPLTYYITDMRCNVFLRQFAYDQLTASIYGPNAQSNLLRGGVQDAWIDDSGNRVYVAKQYRADGVVNNPMVRKAQIGEFFTCRDPSSQYKDYTSEDRTQQFWNEKANKYSEIDLQSKLNNCYRFDDETGRLRNITSLPYNQRANLTDKDKESFANDFLHRKNANGEIVPITYYGQMKSHHFTAQDYSNFADTVFNYLDQKTKYKRADYDHAIRKLSELLSIIDQYEYDANFNQYGWNLAEANVDRAVNRGPNAGLADLESNDIKNNEFGSLNIVANIQGSGWQLPPTHGNYGGFKTIAKALQDGTWAQLNPGFSQIYAEQIKDAIEIFDRFADSLRYLLPESVIMSPRWSSPNVHNPTHRHVLFENLVARNNPSRFAFLHIVSQEDQLRGNNVAGIERAGAYDDAVNVEAVNFGDEIFPESLIAKKLIMDTVIGNLSPHSFSMNQAQALRVGAPLRVPTTRVDGNGAQLNVPFRYATEQTPAANVRVDKSLNTNADLTRPTTWYVRNRFDRALGDGSGVTRAFTAADGPDFNQRANTRTLELAKAPVGSPLRNVFEDLVFDTLVRWTLLPDVKDFPFNDGQLINYYASRAVILTVLSLVRRTNASNFGRVWDNYAPVLDEIQRITGLFLHRNDTVDYNNVIRTLANGRVYKDLSTGMPNFYQQNPSYFASKVSFEGFKQILEEGVVIPKEEASKTYATRSGLLRLIPDPNNPGAYRRGMDVELGTYLKAPISLGANAMKSFVSFLLQTTPDNMVSIIPSSYGNPNTQISRMEIDTIQELQRGAGQMPPDVLLAYYELVGPVFADKYTTDIGSMSIDSLPAVRNARIRALTPEEISRRDAERLRKIASQQALMGQSRGGDNTTSMFASGSEFGRESRRRRINNGGFAVYGDSNPSEDAEPASKKARRVLTTQERISGAVEDQSIANEFANESLTQEMRDMFKDIISTEADDMAAQIVALTRLFTPVTKNSVEATIKYNLVHPWNYLCVRPFATYSTVSIIKLKPGVGTGHVSLGHILTEPGDDPDRQMMFLGVHAYYGAVITNPKNIFILNDVLVFDYHSGMEDGFIRPETFEPHRGRFGSLPSDSFIIFAISRGEKVPDSFISLTGALTMTDRQGNTDHRNPNGNMYNYGTAAYYNGIWGFNRAAWRDSQSYPTNARQNYSGQVVTPNHIAFHGFARTKRGHHISENNGHWLPHTVFPGAHLARVAKGAFNNGPATSQHIAQVGGPVVITSH